VLSRTNDPYHNSIITAGNGGTKPTQAAFTIFYNQGTQKYELEQTLQPDEQMWIDVGRLISEHVPDKNGNLLPGDLTSGSYEFRDLTNKHIGTLFEGKIVYDKTYGHVTYGCGYCCGYNYVQLMRNPLGVPLDLTADNAVQARDVCAGITVDVSDAFYNNWSTASTTIATVDYYGTHTGHALGSTTSNTHGDLPSKTRFCPINTCYPGGGDNVAVMPKIMFGGNDITGTTQSVVVGQQIALTASYGLPSGVTVNSQSWSVPGTITGGFVHNDTNGGPAAYSLTGKSTTFYWYSTPNYAKASYQVTFTLHLSDGASPSATTTFSVAGTSAPSGNITPGSNAIVSGDLLQYIGSGGLPGMTFHVYLNLPPSGYSGIFTWDQIRTDSWVRTPATGSARTCTAPSNPSGLSTGQDTSYPYAVGDQTQDSPYVSLYATDIETSRTFSATMYAMWDPHLPNSIPVPLGYIQWNFSGDATITNAATNQWTLKSSSAGSNKTFTPSSSYLQWSGTLGAGEVCH
jgi:hypothetical protein